MKTSASLTENLPDPTTLTSSHHPKSAKRGRSLLALAAFGGLALANPAQAVPITWQAGANSGDSSTWNTTFSNWNTAIATPWAAAGNFAELGSASVTLGADVRMDGFSGSGSIGASSTQQLRIGGAGVTSTFSGTIGNNVRVIWDNTSILDFSGTNNVTAAASQWLFRNGGTFRLSSANAWQTTNVAKVEASAGTFTFELAAADLRINTTNMYLNNSGTGNIRFAALGADRTVTYTGSNTTVSAPAATIDWTTGSGTGTSIGDTLGLGNANSTGKLIWASGINLNGGNASVLTRKLDAINGTGGAIGGEISGVISDSGTTKATLEKTGTGMLVLSGNNTYTGATTVSAGTLQFAKTASLYNGTDSNWTKTNITASSGGTVALNVGGTGEFSTGNVTTLLTNLTGDVTTGGFKGGSSIGFDTTNASGGNFSVANTIADTTGTGGGTLGVTKLGTNTLTLSGNNTYTGATAVSAGTLEFAPASGSSTLTGNVTGAGAILKSGAGTLILASAVSGGSSFSGSLAVNGGTLQIGNIATSNDSTGRLASVTSVTVGSGGTLSLAASSALNSGAAITLNGTINVNTLGMTSNLGFHNVLGALTMNGGTLTTGNGANQNSYQSIALNGNVTVSGTSASNITAGGSQGNAIHLLSNAAGNRTFDVADVTSSSAADLTVSARLINASGGLQAAGLIKSGAGTMVLSGNNTYTGTTTVTTGTLLVNGNTSSSSAVNVSSGATLGGNGTIGGATTINGILAPGNSIGQLNINANTTWAGAAAAGATTDWKFELGAGNTADLLNITGDFLKDTAAGTKFEFNFLASAATGTFKLVDWTGTTGFSSGDFTWNNLGGGNTVSSFNVDGATTALYVTVIPEPATWDLLAFSLTTVLVLRRRRNS